MDVIGDLKGYDGMTSGLFSALSSAELIVAAARKRNESRGGHFRTDFPERSAEPFHSLCRMSADGVSVEHAPLETTVELEPAE
jgi:L-aspartate oxidase